MDFSNVKSITIPEGVVKKIEDANGNVLWKGSWTYTINIGDYVSTVRYKIDSGNWTTISANTTLEIDSGLTLYIQALSYNTDTAEWDYTLYNGDISRTDANDGGSVTVYQTRQKQTYAVTISGTHCSADKSSGTYEYGTVITWTGESGTNYKYGFASNPTWSSSYATTTATITGAGTYSKTASYLYYNVTITKNAGTASSNYSSGYLLNGTTVTFTATANTSTTRYSYSNTSSSTHTNSHTVSSAGQSISSPTVYTWYYITVNANTGSSVTANGTGWYLSGSGVTSTWTISNANLYTFNSIQTTSTTTTTVTWTANSSKTITAPTVYQRLFIVTLNSTYGHWENSDGTTITSTTCPYNVGISTSSNTLTIDSIVYTFVVNSETSEYRYIFDSITWTPTGSTITTATTVSGVAMRESKAYSIIVNLQANESGTIKIGSGTAQNIVSGQAYSVDPNQTYVITVNSINDYIFDSVPSDWTGSSSMTVNWNQTKYQTISRSFTATGSATYTMPSVVALGEIDLNYDESGLSGSIIFNANSYTLSVNSWYCSSDEIYYTGTISVDITFNSDYRDQYGSDGKVIQNLNVSGFTSGEYTITHSTAGDFTDALILDNDDTAADNYYQWFKIVANNLSPKIYRSIGTSTKDTRCVYIVNNSGVTFEFCTKDQYTPGDSSIAGWSVGVTNGTSKYIICPYSSSSYDYGTLYAFNWDYVLTEVETEDGSPSTYYMANIAYKQYTVTVYNRSSYEIVLDSYSTGKHSISAGSSKTLTYNWGTSSKFDFKKSDGSGGWSSTITYSSDSDVRSNHALSAYISANSVYDWQWHDDSKTPTATYNNTLEWLAGSTYTCWGGYSGTNPFNRDSSSNRVKITINDTDYISEIPDGMPYSFDDSSDTWDFHSKSTITPSGYTIGGILQDVGDEDRELYGIIGVKGNFSSSGALSVKYGTYTYDYIRTDYSPYWG